MLKKTILVTIVFLIPILGCKFNLSNESQASNQNPSFSEAENEAPTTMPTSAPIQTSESPQSKHAPLPADLIKYVGEPPGDLMNNPAVEARMKPLLGKEFSNFWEYMAVQNSVEQKGDFLYATGCASGLCTILETALLIDLESNRVHAMIFQSGEPVQFFNEDGVDTPQLLIDRAKELGESEQADSGDTEGKIGKCLLVVDGKTFLSEQCKITTEKDGSFQIINTEKQVTYFAQVQLGEDGAIGYWNEEKGANHAHTPLGKLKRDGACWVNRRAKVCAWR